MFSKPTTGDIANRFCHHNMTGDKLEACRKIRWMIEQLAQEAVNLTPCSPEQARGLNALDEAMFLFNAAIARHEA